MQKEAAPFWYGQSPEEVILSIACIIATEQKASPKTDEMIRRKIVPRFMNINYRLKIAGKANHPSQLRGLSDKY